MNTLTSGKPFTIDPDYEKFSGRVVQTFTTTYYDERAKAWIKRTVEYIDVGRPHKVEPVDAEAAMTPEVEVFADLRGEKGIKQAQAANKRRNVKLHMEIQRKVTDYLRTYGPMTCAEIARDLDIATTTLNRHLLDRMDRVYNRTTSGKFVIWGLTGIHDKEAA